MRGVSAPTRLAAAGVRIVHSAPVSSSRVTGAPLATRVTIGALRRVATVISPTRLVPHPTARVSAAAVAPPSADATKRQTDNECRNVNSLFVFPAEAGSRDPRTEPVALDPRFRGGDGNASQTCASF